MPENQELKPEFGFGMTPIDERLEEKTEDRVEKGHTIGHRGRLTHLPSLVPFRHGVGVFLDAHGQSRPTTPAAGLPTTSASFAPKP